MAMLSIPRRPPPLFYGWYIVGASTVNAALLLGMVFYGFGVFITPLTNDLAGRPPRWRWDSRFSALRRG